jgi:hypothetical protein
MRSGLRKLVFVAVVAVGASGFLGSSAPAVGGDWNLYANGTPAVSQSSGRGGYSGYYGRQNAYQVPASSPGAVTGYWYYSPQPVYQVPASSPGAVTGYRYSYPVRR